MALLPSLLVILFILSYISQVSPLTCHCTVASEPEAGDNPTRCDNFRFCQSDGGLCFSESVRLGNGGVADSSGCLSPSQIFPPSRPFACEDMKPYGVKRRCCKTDYCNGEILLNPYTFPPPPSTTTAVSTLSLIARDPGMIMAIVFGFLVFVCLVVLLTVFTFRWRKSLRKNVGAAAEVGRLMEDPSHVVSGDSAFSGSGSGLPLLSQRTVARQISLVKPVGKGRYGEVWLGHWHGENVAVKIFDSRDDKSWMRETEIYGTTMLRHENLLGFIAADNKDTGLLTQLWLITDYHDNGSLFDYLTINTVDLAGLLRLSFSIANGLAHLHMEIVGTQGKPAIAHRDMKSKNILVKQSGQCAIADLGLAVRYNSVIGLLDIPVNDKVGTNRYLAPEVLDDTINKRYFESFRAADVYGMGLVFWEICRRCDATGVAESYQLPYFDTLPDDPELDIVKVVVCDQQIRPKIPDSWSANETTQRFSRIVTECFYANPLARLTVLRIKKTLAALMETSDVKL